jgi:hypothetical protein
VLQAMPGMDQAMPAVWTALEWRSRARSPEVDNLDKSVQAVMLDNGPMGVPILRETICHCEFRALMISAHLDPDQPCLRALSLPPFVIHAALPAISTNFSLLPTSRVFLLIY